MEFGGAALVSATGELIEIGSLFVHDAAPPLSIPGNMFIPMMCCGQDFRRFDRAWQDIRAAASLAGAHHL